MNSAREFIGQRTGFTVLAIATAFIAAWLAMQGAQLVEQRQAKRSLVPLEPTGDLNRFRADTGYLPNEPLLGFVEIPAGRFIIGSDPVIDDQAYANERWSATSYQGHIELPTFYISRYEVTVAQFHAFISANGFVAADAVLREPATHPVTSVSWADALAYANWLDAMLRQSPHTPATIKKMFAAGYRVTLPTEAEWEKAARSADGRIYPWGNAPSSEHAQFRAAAAKPVGSVACSDCAFGLADMSGNVWELTRSRYQPYPFDATDNAINLQSDALFVMRGGSFSDTEGNIRAAVRGGIDPGARRPNIGFRVALTKM